MNAIEPADDTTPSPPPSPSPLPDITGIVALMKNRVDAGWRWDDATATLSDPADPEASFHVDPKTHRVTLSPKLATQLGQSPSPQEPQP